MLVCPEPVSYTVSVFTYVSAPVCTLLAFAPVTSEPYAVKVRPAPATAPSNPTLRKGLSN